MSFVSTILKKTFLNATIVLLLFMAFLQPAFSTHHDVKRILIVNSYHNDFVWTDNQVSAAKEVLSNAFHNVEYFIEYMDTKRLYNPEYLDSLAQTFSMKYKNTDLDGILTTDDNALKFVLKNRSLLNEDVPIVFSGINLIDDIPLEGEKNIAGFVEVLDIKETIDLALDLKKGINKIVVVSDNTETGKGQRKEVAAVESQFPGIEFKYIDGDKYSTKEMLNEISILSDDTIVLLTVWLRDKHDMYISEEGGKEISLISSVPVYGIVDVYLKKGIVGGKILSSSDHGREAAMLLAKILKEGSDLRLNIVNNNSINKYAFDFMQLKRWNIGLSLLPKGSTIINRPFSVFNEYKWHILAGIFLVFAQFVMIVVFILNINRRKRTEVLLLKSEEKYRFMAENSRDIIYRMSLRSGQYEYVSPASKELLGYSPKELYENPMLIRKVIHPDSRDYFEEEWKKLLSGNIPPTYEYQIIHGSGEAKWMYQRNVLILDENGKPLAIEAIVTDVTERKMVEESLRKEKEAAQRYLDIVGAIVLALDVNGDITLINKRGLEILGYEEEEVLGKNWFKTFLPYSLYEKVENIFKQLMEGTVEPAEYFENMILNKKGEERLIAWHNAIIKDPEGSIIGVLSSGEDITERKKAEDALKEREIQLRLIMENMGDMIVQLLPDRTIVYVSPSCMNLLGYRRNELMNNNYSDFVHRDDVDQVFDVIQNSADKKDEDFHQQYRLIHKQGNCLWVDAIGKLIYSAEGVLKEIQFSVRDITEKKKIEDALKKSEALMKRSVEGMLDGYALHEAIFNDKGRMVDYRFLEFNPAAQKISNISREDILGRTALELYPHIVERGLLDKYADVMATGKPIYINDYHYGGDNLDKALDIACFCIDEDHFVCIFKDVTEKIKSNEELIKAKEKAEQINAAKSEFLMNVSHDIRTPMNVINGFNDLLMKTQLSEDQKKFCTMIKRKGKDLIRLIEDIIDISFVEKGKVRIHKSPLSLYAIFEDIKSSIEVLIGDKELEFTFKVTEDVPKRLLGDSMRLKQIFENLCGNAVKFTKKGNISLTASVEGKGSGDDEKDIRFEIEDTGIGISKENISHIFEPYARFYEKGQNENNEGVGMGLHIVDTLVKEMGGKITVNSKLGKGSKFSFVLRMIVTEIQESEIKVVLSDKPDKEGKLSSINILIAEDDDATRILMERSLRDADCNIKFACDGDEAVDEMKKNKYDLVLMDLRMPRMDGLEATREIRKNIDKEVPIIALTAHAMTFVEDHCKAAGMNGYLSKPVDIDKLIQVIQKYLK